MLKSAFLRKTICITTIFSFSLAVLPKTANAYGYRLTPESFEEMYSLAQSGRVEALRASVNRGLNIDAMNSDGDTGLCVAARRHDSYTYNSFRAAGANPRHPCTQTINDYEDFIVSSRAVSPTSTPRAAYGALGKEDYSVSPRFWWWVGGAAVVGGVLALGLGHGGGHGSSSSSSGDDPKEDYNSLGEIAGTEGDIRDRADNTTKNNTKYIEMANSQKEKVDIISLNTDVLANTKYLDVALKSVNDGIYTNTKDTVLKIGRGTIGMSAEKNSYINNYGFINIDSYNASLGMVASEGSTAINYGKGIIDDGSGVLSNNGIALNFSGFNEGHTLVGMYADTKSILQNFGDIKGTAIESVENVQEVSDDTSGLVNPNAGEDAEVKKSAANGTLVGMEAMIINAGKDLNKDTIRLQNEQSGKVNLSAGDAGASESEIRVSLIGMGSFLDYGFMNGSQNINRAEKVEMKNYGDITVGYTGNYVSSSENSLRKGTGGLIGMRADANASAYNYNNINLNLEEYSEGSSNIDVSAGMQSIHGANLYNSGNIKIRTSAGNQRKNYGILSVEGSGSVSGLYTDLKQKLINDKEGNISVEASNSFGIASFNGGELSNAGTITLGREETTTQYQKNIAMYAYGKSKEATMKNTGIIDIFSHDSIAMQNDFAGGISIYNKGIVNVHESATNSYVFGGAYSEAHNSNTINYEANSTGQASSDGRKYDPFANYTLSIGNSIISTQSRSVLGETSTSSSSTTEKIYNDEDSIINMNGSSYVSVLSVEADDTEQTQGKAFNNGTINIVDSIYSNATNTVGMYLGQGSLNNAYIINNNTINTNSRFSAAMASASTQNASMINNGSITAEKKYSLGMYSNGISNIQNNKDLMMNADQSVGIYSAGSAGKTLISNSADATIKIGKISSKTENSYGIYIADEAQATIENNGLIDIYTRDAGAGIYSKGSDITIENHNTININGDDAYAIYTEGDGIHANIINYADGVINVGSKTNKTANSYGIYNKASGEQKEDLVISNKGTINLYNNEENEAFAIYSIGNSDITNEGIISLNGEKSTAIYADSGRVINKNTLNIEHSNNIGLKSSKGAEVINDTNGIINVGREDNSVSNSSGMAYIATNDGESTQATGMLTNNGTINLYGTENANSHAVSIQGNATFTNNNIINSHNGYSSAIFISDPQLSNYTMNEAEVINTGEISVEGSYAYAVRSTLGSSISEEDTGSLKFNNSGRITVGTGTLLNNNSYGVYADRISSLINSGIFVVYNTDSYAIYAGEGETISNTGSITMNGKNDTAIYGGKVNFIYNNGKIVLNKESSKGIHTTGTGEIENNNNITLIDANGGYGIYATGKASVVNSQNGIITIGQNSVSASNGNAIYAPSATSIENYAPLYVYASGSGITGGEEINNMANITVAQNNSKGISSNGKSVINNGSIRILESGRNYGIYATESVSILNDTNGSITLGTIINTNGNDYGIYAPLATDITNKALITMYTSGTAINGWNGIVNSGRLRLYQNNSIGIASDGDSIENSGVIYISAPNNSYGIKSSGEATILNTETGAITIGDENTTATATNAYGISANEAKSITNSANIRIYATGSYGIDGGNTKDISNNGNINLYGDANTGIKAATSENVSNYKNINISKASDSYGINVGTAEVTNAEGARITIGSSTVTGGEGNYGINAVDGSIKNNGDIYIYGGGYGIHGQLLTSIDNNGVIMLKNTGSTGIYSASGIVTNNGTINMTGTTATGIYYDGSDSIQNNSGAAINVISGTAILANRNTRIINDGFINVSNSGYGISNALSVDNSGSINLGSGTAINAKGSVNNSGDITINDTGVAVVASSLDNSGEIEVDNTSITAAVSVSGSVTNTGKIAVSSSGTAVENATSLDNSGNITVGSGTAVNAVREVTNSGIIKTSSGTAVNGASSVSNSGKIFGTNYGVNGGTQLVNDTNAVISISSGTAAVNGVSTVNNSGTIEVTGRATAAILGATNVTNDGIIRIFDGHGIYTTNPGEITNNGSITVSSGNGNGIHVVVPTVGTKVNITNTGTISVARGYAIFVEKNYALNTETVHEGDVTGTRYYDNTNVDPGSLGEGAVKYGGSCGQHCKNGEIEWYGPTPNTSSLIAVTDSSLYSNVRLLNLGQITLSGNVDFGSVEDNTSSASIGRNGTYEADSFSGTVIADSSLVEGGFDTVYINENAFVGADNGLDILSQSYLFDASLMSTTNGNISVVMTMSSFEDKVSNSRIADYLSKNYSAQKGEAVFDLLKSASTKAQFDDYLNKELGFSMIPNLTEQSLDIEKMVNNELIDDLLVKTNENNRHKVSILTYKNDVDGIHEVSGYRDNVIAAYGYTDKAVNNKTRLGVALSAIRSDSNFDDDSHRYNNMLELSVPVILEYNDTSVMFKPKAGFARGHYSRAAVNKSYKAKTKEFYYGFDSAARHHTDLGFAMLEPNVGFNFTGLYTDDINESKDGLKIKDNNVISAPVYFGLDIRKDFVFNKNNSLSLLAGGKYFHEFGNKGNRHATVNDMIGRYDIINSRFKRNYGLLSIKAAYTYSKFVLSASVNAPLEQKHNPYYMLNLGYGF